MCASVVIDDFYIEGAGVSPLEANPVLLVDADAVLGAIIGELFQPVSWWSLEVCDVFSGVD